MLNVIWLFLVVVCEVRGLFVMFYESIDKEFSYGVDYCGVIIA